MPKDVHIDLSYKLNITFGSDPRNNIPPCRDIFRAFSLPLRVEEIDMEYPSSFGSPTIHLRVARTIPEELFGVDRKGSALFGI